jgi:hypothetical protein
LKRLFVVIARPQSGPWRSRESDSGHPPACSIAAPAFGLLAMTRLGSFNSLLKALIPMN